MALYGCYGWLETQNKYKTGRLIEDPSTHSALPWIVVETSMRSSSIAISKVGRRNLDNLLTLLGKLLSWLVCLTLTWRAMRNRLWWRDALTIFVPRRMVTALFRREDRSCGFGYI